MRKRSSRCPDPSHPDYVRCWVCDGGRAIPPSRKYTPPIPKPPKPPKPTPKDRIQPILQSYRKFLAEQVAALMAGEPTELPITQQQWDRFMARNPTPHQMLEFAHRRDLGGKAYNNLMLLKKEYETRLALRLHVEGVPNDQIAERLGLPENEVRRRIMKVLQKGRVPRVIIARTDWRYTRTPRYRGPKSSDF